MLQKCKNWFFSSINKQLLLIFSYLKIVKNYQRVNYKYVEEKFPFSMFKKLVTGEVLHSIIEVCNTFYWNVIYICDLGNSSFSMFKKLGSLNVSKWKAGLYRSFFGVVGIDPTGIIRKGLVLGEFYESKRISS